MKPIIVVCGPSGAGKSTLLKRLCAQHPADFAFSVSHTTRQPREGEEDGREYHFVDRDRFCRMVRDGDFVEFAEFARNMYGTSKAAIARIQQEGRRCVLDVDLQGVKAVRRLGLFARIIAVNPPSVEALGDRLAKRGTETPAAVEERLRVAQQDMAELAACPELCDLVVVNSDLDAAYKQLSSFIYKDM